LQGKSPYQSNPNQAPLKSQGSKEALKLKNQNTLAKTRNSRISLSNDPASNQQAISHDSSKKQTRATQ